MNFGLGGYVLARRLGSLEEDGVDRIPKNVGFLPGDGGGGEQATTGTVKN